MYKLRRRLIMDDISPLIKPPKGEDDLARFYDKLLYTLISKRVESETTEFFIGANAYQIERVARISKKLLQEISIPQVMEKKALIAKTLDELFWKQDGIKHLEQIRKNIRLLVKYLDKDQAKYVTTNFERVLP